MTLCCSTIAKEVAISIKGNELILTSQIPLQTPYNQHNIIKMVEVIKMLHREVLS